MEPSYTPSVLQQASMCANPPRTCSIAFQKPWSTVSDRHESLLPAPSNPCRHDSSPSSRPSGTGHDSVASIMHHAHRINAVSKIQSSLINASMHLTAILIYAGISLQLPKPNPCCPSMLPLQCQESNLLIRHVTCDENKKNASRTSPVNARVRAQCNPKTP